MSMSDPVAVTWKAINPGFFFSFYMSKQDRLELEVLLQTPQNHESPNLLLASLAIKRGKLMQTCP